MLASYFPENAFPQETFPLIDTTKGDLTRFCLDSGLPRRGRIVDAHQVQFLRGRMKDQYTKKALVTVMLAFAIAATSQQTAPPPPTGQTQSGSTANQKVIKDPAEYNAYIRALNTQDPATKAAAMETFVQQYPKSIVVMDALEQAMAAYQQAGDAAKVVEVAKRVLQVTPNHIRALAVVAAIERAKATAGDQAALQESCSYSQTGLQQLSVWQKPEELRDQDFEKLRHQIADIFDGAAGFCALQKKDYANARTFYEKAFQMDPTSLQDIYQLAVADLEMIPIDLNGLWYCSKAIALAQPDAKTVNSITPYCKAHYKRYHGGEDGWEQMVAGTTTETALPLNFPSRIKPALTACELAVQAVQQNDMAILSFSDKEFILSKADCSPANKAAADKVWQSLRDTQKGGAARVRFPAVKVISSTQDSIDVALTDDNQAANTADVHVLMAKPMLHPPAAGSMTDIIGALTDYTPRPFMFTMEKGELPDPSSPTD
jgi:tetratricopeptide (TPR) repeat protein